LRLLPRAVLGDAIHWRRGRSRVPGGGLL